MKTSVPKVLTTLVLLALAALPTTAAEKIKVRLAPMPGMGQVVPQLAVGLGYFEQEGLAVEMVSAMEWIDEDWLSADLLNNGTIDAEVNWFHRVVYGTGNGQPLKAIVLLEDSPGMKILVANQLKDQIKDAADFKGRRVSCAAGFSTKRYLTELITARAGVALKDITFMPDEFQTHRPAPDLIKALRNRETDVLTIMDPVLRSVEESGMMALLYDLTNREGTKAALGEVWPARCLFVSPKFIEKNPVATQKLVNAFVRTLRFMNTHTAEEIFAKLPLSYFDPHTNNDHYKEYRAAEKLKVTRALSTFTKGNFAMPPAAAAFATKVTLSADFDDTPEGKYRKSARAGHVVATELYDNRFVEQAMQAIK
jgi:NitT/TauT family transport system substrate-binding protein